MNLSPRQRRRTTYTTTPVYHHDHITYGHVHPHYGIQQPYTIPGYPPHTYPPPGYPPHTYPPQGYLPQPMMQPYASPSGYPAGYPPQPYTVPPGYGVPVAQHYALPPSYPPQPPVYQGVIHMSPLPPGTKVVKVTDDYPPPGLEQRVEPRKNKYMVVRQEEPEVYTQRVYEQPPTQVYEQPSTQVYDQQPSLQSQRIYEQ